MSLPSVLAVLVLLLGVPLNLYVTIRLRRISRENPRIPLVRFQYIVSSLVLLTVVVFGVIFVNNDLPPPPPLGFAETKLFTRGVLLVLSIVPAAYWLHLTRERR